MKVFFWSVTLLTLSFLIQLIVWRIRLPRRQTLVMLKIFFSVLLAGIGFLYIQPDVFLLGIEAPVHWTERVHIALFFVAMTLAYMITYSALEADSPSLVMILNIAQQGQQGLEKDNFDRLMTDDVLVKPRVRDLLTDEMAYMDGEKYRLTPKGESMAKMFNQFRKLLKAKHKGG